MLEAASASKRFNDLRSVTVVLFIAQFLRAARPLSRWRPSSLSSIILVMGAGGLFDSGCQLVDCARNCEKSFDDVGRLAIAVRLVGGIFCASRSRPRKPRPDCSCGHECCFLRSAAAKLEALSRWNAEQICRTPDDVILQFVDSFADV